MAGGTLVSGKPVAARRGGFAARNSNLFFAGGVVLLFIIMLIPLPGWMMDFLLIINIVVSLMVLLSAIYVDRPLKMNSFPTILLVVTFFRLAL
ncbi:MAG: FHIPEP family type III secretion protein, partial [Planctomycetes bacterium]|nr:FHIPEP family type III secretion protein [Planctomycetota bacterium]